MPAGTVCISPGSFGKTVASFLGAVSEEFVKKAVPFNRVDRI